MAHDEDRAELLLELAGTGPVVGGLAADEDSFRRLVDAHDRVDAGTFREVLTRAGVLSRCDWVCGWLCSKSCTLLCLRLAGPPDEADVAPEGLRRFAMIMARATQDRDILARLVAAVERPDPAAFAELVGQLEIQPYRHLLCHWVCAIRCRWACRLLCSPEERPDRLDLGAALQAEAAIVGRLARDADVFDKAADLGFRQDCKGLLTLISDVGLLDGCEVICWWFCSWRCLRICRRVCLRLPPPAVEDPVKEMLAFAAVTERLSARPDALAGLLDALDSDDADAFPRLVAELGFEGYCFQICHWLCRLRCRRFCLCVCPPVLCELLGPVGCVEELLDDNLGGMTVTVTGSAAGGAFAYYTLQYRKSEGLGCQDDSGWIGDPQSVVYPGGGSAGTTPVVGGTLGTFVTTLWSPGAYDVRLCVYTGAKPTAPTSCCCSGFSLFKKIVVIAQVAGVPVRTPPGPFVSTAPLALPPGPAGVVIPVGSNVTVTGYVHLGDCNVRKIACMDLRLGVGTLPGPGEPGFNPGAFSIPMLANGPVCYTDPIPAVEAKKRAPWNDMVGLSVLTAYWQPVTIQLGNVTLDLLKLQPASYPSDSALPLGVSAGPCPDLHHRRRSGRYTMLLEVTDTFANTYYDTQQIWFDNKPITVRFDGLEGLPPCADLRLKAHVPAGAPCNQPWPMNALGIAFDELIDETDMSYPSLNFDFYELSVCRQNGPTFQLPITQTLTPYNPATPRYGNQRVGDPGVRSEPAPTVAGCPPPLPVPPTMSGLLTQLDLRMFSAPCASSLQPPYVPPAGFALNPDECCAYTFSLHARDKTWTDGLAGGLHWGHSEWPLNVCNDT